jgi:UDP-N-acetylmuramate: L-alanyl-gamma-D-glutamyl-meso-diaminopimelate ligase
MSIIPSAIYEQSVDKQRIAIFGKSQDRIFQLVSFILNNNQKIFDYVADDQQQFSKAPLLVWKAGEANAHSMDFHHHILIISAVSPVHMEEIHWMEKLADATPKGGMIIFDSTDAQAKRIGSKERTDVTNIAFDVFKHETKNNQTLLVTSTDEKFAVPFSGQDALKAASAARELLKKIGISSGQFYRAISSIQQ